MRTPFHIIAACFDQWAKLRPRLRSLAMYLRTGIKFKKVGKHAKVYGSSRMSLGRHIVLGDYCWIEAVSSYAGIRYSPRLVIGDRVSLSDLTHISCLKYVQIGADCLLGSKIYIGDHNHGSTSDLQMIQNIAPARRPLGDAAEIVIGEKVWICDGAVILPGARIGNSSIVGANSVVRLQEERPALIAGIPARVIKYLDETDGNEAR